MNSKSSAKKKPKRVMEWRLDFNHPQHGLDADIANVKALQAQAEALLNEAKKDYASPDL